MQNFKILKKALFLLIAFQFIAFTQLKSIDFIFDGIGMYTDASLWTPHYPGGNISVGNSVTIMAGSDCTVPTGTLLFISGTLTNNAEMTINNSWGAFGDGTLINNGLIISNAIVDNLGNITNNGEIISNDNFSSQGNGTFINATAGTITINTTMIAFGILEFDGLLRGIGDVVSTDYPNEGVISPGFSPGIISFSSGLNLGLAGTLEIEIEGYAGAGLTGGHDQIQVTNGSGLVINGTLSVILANGFIPVVGDQWIIATGTTSGAFSTLDLPSGYNWLVDITANSIILEIVDTTLPLALLNFEGKQSGENVHLNWTASSELNATAWTIQHSTESENWKDIAVIHDNTNSTNINEYSYIHLKPATKNNYYRLSKEDHNGNYILSEVVHVNLDSRQVTTHVYPNPSYGLIYFNKDVNSIILRDFSGKQLMKRKINDNSLLLGQEYKGMYILEIHTEQGIETQKVFLK